MQAPWESFISLWHEEKECIMKNFEKFAVTNNYNAVPQNLIGDRFQPLGF